MLTKASDTERLSNEQLMQTLKRAECIVSKLDVMRAYDELAARLNAHYTGRKPIIFVAMNGGMIPAGQLMMRLSFFHRMAYIHATRYQQNKASDTLLWQVKPPEDIMGEHVLIIDDIFDEGVTLKTIVQELQKKQPASIKTCVLLDKQHARKPADFTVDFVGLTIPDRYVFGCGMDYHGYLRHLSGIYAI